MHAFLRDAEIRLVEADLELAEHDVVVAAAVEPAQRTEDREPARRADMPAQAKGLLVADETEPS